MYEQYIVAYLEEMADIASKMAQDPQMVKTINGICQTIRARKIRGGRVFFAGVGGSSGTSSHACNDFSKIFGIPAICLSDNSSLVTAITNDKSWPMVFVDQLKQHVFTSMDILFILSVNGGTDTISPGIRLAIEHAKAKDGMVMGIVGRPDGYVQEHGDLVCVIPVPDVIRRTPHSESWQLVLIHLFINAIVTGGNFQTS